MNSNTPVEKQWGHFNPTPKGRTSQRFSRRSPDNAFFSQKETRKIIIIIIIVSEMNSLPLALPRRTNKTNFHLAFGIMSSPANQIARIHLHNQ